MDAGAGVGSAVRRSTPSPPPVVRRPRPAAGPGGGPSTPEAAGADAGEPGGAAKRSRPASPAGSAASDGPQRQPLAGRGIASALRRRCGRTVRARPETPSSAGCAPGRRGGRRRRGPLTVTPARAQHRRRHRFGPQDGCAITEAPPARGRPTARRPTGTRQRERRQRQAARRPSGPDRRLGNRQQIAERPRPSATGAHSA